MANDVQDGTDQNQQDFDRLAEEGSVGLIAEFCAFLAHNKKWWLAPILLALLLVGLLIFLSTSAVAPFIYPLF